MYEQRQSPARGTPAQAIAIPFWAALVVAAVLYICFFSHLTALGLVGPDEPRYAAVAREMAERGDWVTPRLYGRPWFEKPVLYYWGAALAFRALGVNEFSARLPSALAATLAALALAWAARHFYGSATAWIVLLLLPASLGMFSFARAAAPDMLFSAALTAALVAASTIVSPRGEGAAGRRTATLALAAFGVFLAAATLAKGPAAIVLAGGSVGLWALVTRRWREALRLAHPVAVASFSLVALPWYALCASRNPEFLPTFLFAHNLERYLTPVFRHVQPSWFFVPVLLAGLLPWTALLVGVARDALLRRREKSWIESPGFFFACWAVFPVVFFSFSQSKLPSYVLPAIPPLVLLLARSLARAIAERAPFAGWLYAGVGVTFIGLGVSASYWRRSLPQESNLADPNSLFPWTIIAIAGGLTLAVLGPLSRARLPWAGVLIPAVMMAILIEGANRSVLPQLDADLSARSAARVVRGEPALENLSVYRLHRAWHFGLNFYLRREVPELTPQTPRPAWVYTSAAGLAELKRQNRRFAVVWSGSAQALLISLQD